MARPPLPRLPISVSASNEAAMTNVLENVAHHRPVNRPRPDLPAPQSRRGNILPAWLKAQGVNVTRHAAGLRPFKRDEFGDSAASPTEGHILAVNQLVTTLRKSLLAMTQRVTRAASAATAQPSPENVTRLVSLKDHSHTVVQAIEKVWDFYFELFGQRQTRFADWLLSCDRIALDCYQYTYLGLGIAKSLPAPPPYSYMRTGFSPATFRRDIPLEKLGSLHNPFPLIQLPYHRLMNPWTLGAILHEVSHNLQNDLGLDRIIPAAMEQRLLRDGMPAMVAGTWKRWNRELFADACGLLFGGPQIVASLMDVVGRARANTLTFSPGAPHPTPFFRTLISCELLRRMGFEAEAAEYRRSWLQLYPNHRAGDIPKILFDTFDRANALIIDTVCYQPYAALGNKSLAQVLRFERKEQSMIEECAQRLANGTDPGIVPERFYIGAARVAFDHRLARPGVIMKNFYRALSRR
jgi:hypothetical protein